MALANEVWLNKIFVDKRIKQLIEEDFRWESYLTKQAVDSLIVLYYKEQYFVFETPNDAALGKTLDPKGRAPANRAEGGAFPHADISVPVEDNLRLYQLALEMDWTEEELKYQSLENRVLKKQERLSQYFTSEINTRLGNILTESWSTSPTSIQQVSIASGDEWSLGPTDETVVPYKDILDAVELIDDVAGYDYSPTGMFVSKQSYYDLLLWLTAKDYQYQFQGLNTKHEVLQFLGLDVIKTNMVKRDFAIVADFKACGILYESEPVRTHTYFTDEDHMHHAQIMRTFNFALTDPKAVCTIKNTVG